MSRPVSRRTFLQATAAATTTSFVAGCTDSEPKTPGQIAKAYQENATTTDRNNLYNLLSRTNFQDQDGNAISMEGLKAKLGNRFTTVTFGFGECTDVCPGTNANLGKITRAYPNTASIIIGVNPEHDNANAQYREDYKAAIRSAGGPPDAIILYPATGQAAAQISIDSGAIGNLAAPKGHNPSIMLFAPGGKKLGEMPGMGAFSKIDAQWGPLLNGSTIKK